MSQYDELDHEIDQEIDRDMGWSRDKDGKKRNRQPRRSANYWHALLGAARKTNPLFRPLVRLLRAILKIVFFPLISPLGYSKSFNVQGDILIVKRSFLWRIIDGIITRLFLTPVILALFFAGIVYLTTHPEPVQATQNPAGLGLFFRPVSLVSTDGQRLAAWYVPPLKPEEVVINREEVFNLRWPGVVLCHGLGDTHDSYLALASQLHKAGFAVLMLDLRGQGSSEKGAITFGLRERFDVLAGVRFLREQPNIDPGKICLVGHDMAATACLHATALDSSIAAVVADGMWPQFHERVEKIFDNPRVPTKWLAPLYEVTFEISVRERLNQLDPATVLKSIKLQPVLFVAYNGPSYAPVQDVVEMAASVPAPHEVIILDGPTIERGNPDAKNYTPEQRITFFLAHATGWKGTPLKGPETVQRLMESQIK